ncbi:MAG: GntR family transcriptional regulator [Thermoguttaceae bacterium]
MPNTRLATARAARRSPADSRLLKEQAYAALKERIVTGAFPPGTFLSERKLVEQFGMSKTPIRSALERLEAEGLVSVAPRQGIVVREPSIQEVADLFAIRLALERYVLESLAGRLTKEQAGRVKDNLRRQQQAVQADDLTGMVQLDGEFHSLFCEFLGNQEILRVIQQLRERMTMVIGLVFQRNTARMRPNWQEHAGIAAAVIAGDADEAVARLKAHLEYGKQMLLSRP